MATSVKNSNNPLHALPFLREFSETELARLNSVVRERRFARNEVILCEEEASQYMYVVNAGKVKVVQSSASGREKILAIHKKGDFFGEMALLDGHAAPATVIAMEETTIALICRNDFVNSFLRDDKILQHIIIMLCSRLRDAWFMIKVMSFANAEEKLQTVLEHLCDLYGIKDSRGTILPIKLTHKELAEYASLSRETVSRQLKLMERAGQIEILPNRTILLKHHDKSPV
jgi:CRP/FNR family transcriptional regulator, cyclic AMP receptor protein